MSGRSRRVAHQMAVDMEQLRTKTQAPPEPSATSRPVAIRALLDKLERRDRLAPVERAALEALLEPPRLYPAGSAIVMAGDRSTHSSLLLSGVTARQNVTAEGARSFTQLNIAGDFVDLHSLLMEQMDHGVVAITDCLLASAPHGRIIAVTAAHPHLARLLWLDTVIDAAIHRQWLHRMGRQAALGRTAHLICEMEARCEVVGLADETGFDLPLSQSELGDCLGLSAVHVNRTLMELRRLEVVEWRGPRIRLLDRDRLRALAAFDPTYLRLHSAPV
ncbi:Crp/Fnr family transcriptional regulator [Brevundimonas sp.]|uniref:Crp/Fnr family transcriptional regulator n=1 Tax=Brevundimonas sp. TaxID=1871086 RepID=UPI0025BFDB91|nr:Crp/Fnr family transcriptional regulator [Brevundimonas sp.]